MMALIHSLSLRATAGRMKRLLRHVVPRNDRTETAAFFVVVDIVLQEFIMR